MTTINDTTKRAGTVVRTKVHDYPMTVETVNHVDKTICTVWFEGATLKRSMFEVTTILDSEQTSPFAAIRS